MNERQEPVERAVEGARLQTVLRLENRRPAQQTGREIHVPDSDARRLEREPHALLRRAEGLLGLISRGDVPEHRQQVAVGHLDRHHVGREHRPILALELPLAR